MSHAILPDSFPCCQSLSPTPKNLHFSGESHTNQNNSPFPSTVNFSCLGTYHIRHKNRCRRQPIEQRPSAVPKAKLSNKGPTPNLDRDSILDKKSCWLPEFQATKNRNQKMKQNHKIQHSSNNDKIRNQFTDVIISNPDCLNTSVRIHEQYLEPYGTTITQIFSDNNI